VTKLIFQDHQKKQKNYRITNNNTITQETPRFKWFGLTSLHSLAKTIHEKSTIKRWSTKCNTRSNHLNPKVSIHPYLMLTQKRLSENTNETKGNLSLYKIVAVFHYSLAASSSCLLKKKKKEKRKKRNHFSFLGNKSPFVFYLASRRSKLPREAFSTPTHVCGQKTS
jgi:hypothetical protein